jgi:tetraacyldisaccharide 4'-kinase
MKVIEKYSRGMRMFLARGGWSLLLPLRFVLSLCYGMWARQRGREAPARPGRAGEGPFVVSVGNLEVGGSGKTPCVVSLARHVLSKGGVPIVVSRGHGGEAGRSEQPVIVYPQRDEGSHPSAGQELSEARYYGDEVMIYRRKGIPVVVDRDRNRGIEAAAGTFTPTHIFLDDAFHRREVAKDLDLLLLDSRRPFGNGRLLPYGTLREPIDAVSRADAVIFTRSRDGRIPRGAGRYVKDVPVYFARHVAEGIFDVKGNEITCGALAGRKVVLFSGIARPSSFEGMVEGLGIEAEVSYRFDDHHYYTERELCEISSRAAGGIMITTRKDWSKAVGLVPDGAELLCLEVGLEIDGIEDLLALMHKRGTAPHKGGRPV